MICSNAEGHLVSSRDVNRCIYDNGFLSANNSIDVTIYRGISGATIDARYLSHWDFVDVTLRNGTQVHIDLKTNIVTIKAKAP